MAESLLEQLVRDQIAASREQTAATAALTERVDSVIEKIDRHLTADEAVHANHTTRIVASEDFIKDFRKKVALFAAIVVGVWTLVGDVVKGVASAAINSVIQGPPTP